MESQFSPTLVMEHLGMLRRRNIDGVEKLLGFTGITEEPIAPRKASLVLLARDAQGFASVCYDDEGARFISPCSGCMSRDTATLASGVPHSDIASPANVGMTHTGVCKNINHPVAAPPGLAEAGL